MSAASLLPTATSSKPAIRRRASATCSRAARADRARDGGARLGEASRRRRSEIGHQPRGAREAAGAAQVDLPALQKETPPFGGFNVTPPGKAKRLFMSPGPIFEPEGHGEDFGGAARALFAAGFRAGDIVHNCFSYHLTPGAFILEAGAHALGCAVDPRRRRQHRGAARRDRALQADRPMSARRTF